MPHEPLIHTSQGNLPVNTLTHHIEWKESPTQILFIESYKLGDEVVKQSSHVYILTGVASLGEANI